MSAPGDHGAAGRDGAVAAAILAAASQWIGTPYRHQASRRGVGCDCLGLVRGVWRTVYGREPAPLAPYSADWAETAPGDPLMEAAARLCAAKPAAAMAPGDLLLFRWRAGLAAKHAGILSDAGHFIHAYQGHAVLVSPLVPQWRRRLAGVFAFPPRDGRR